MRQQPASESYSSSSSRHSLCNTSTSKTFRPNCKSFNFIPESVAWEWGTKLTDYRSGHCTERALHSAVQWAPGCSVVRTFATSFFALRAVASSLFALLLGQRLPTKRSQLVFIIEMQKGLSALALFPTPFLRKTNDFWPARCSFVSHSLTSAPTVTTVKKETCGSFFLSSLASLYLLRSFSLFLGFFLGTSALHPLDRMNVKWLFTTSLLVASAATSGRRKVIQWDAASLPLSLSLRTASELLCNTTRLYSQIPYIQDINHDFSRCALSSSRSKGSQYSRQPSNLTSSITFPSLTHRHTVTPRLPEKKRSRKAVRQEKARKDRTNERQAMRWSKSSRCRERSRKRPRHEQTLTL